MPEDQNAPSQPKAASDGDSRATSGGEASGSGSAAQAAADIGSDPWAHASYAAPSGPKAPQLWDAVKRCYGRLPPVSQRFSVVLDHDGRYVSLTGLSAAAAPGAPDAQHAAEALRACGPYGGFHSDLDKPLVLEIPSAASV